MGNRALVTFHKDYDGDYSPVVYLHWSGDDVIKYLRRAMPRMRRGDELYSAARFCGYCHRTLSGNKGLGLLPGPPREAVDWSVDQWCEFGHGNQGVFTVNVRSGMVIQYTDGLALATTLNWNKVPC